MACMEHECTECDWATMDNQTRSTCPQCGADLISWFDEDMDRDDDWEGDDDFSDPDIGGEG